MNIIGSAIDKRLDVLERAGLQAPEALLDLLPAADYNRIFEASCQSNSIFSTRGGGLGAADPLGITRAPSSSSSPNMLIGGVQSNISEDEVLKCPFSGGFDGGCEISFFGSWFPSDSSSRQEFFKMLIDAKERARRLGAGGSSVVSLDNRLWVVQPTGAYSKNQFNRFPYRLVSGGVTLLISDQINKGFPNVRVVFGYESLIQSTLKEQHCYIVECLRRSGFVIDREVVSRVDLQVTLALPFELVEKAFSEGRIVSRVRKWTRFDRQGASGLSLGTLTGGHDVQICIYDKFRECVDKRNDEKLEDLYLLSGQEEDLFLRVEFRLRRSALRAMELNTVEEIYNRLPDLIHFLTSDWFRIVQSSKIRGRENKQKLDPFWMRVQMCFNAIFCEGRPRKEVLKMRKKSKLSSKALVRQGFGCLVKAVANVTIRDDAPLSREEFTRTLLKVVKGNIEKYYSDYLYQFGALKLMKEAIVKDDYNDPLALPPEEEDKPLSYYENLPDPDDSELAIPWD